MMRSVIVMSLLAFAEKTSAKANDNIDMQDSVDTALEDTMHKVVDKLVDRAVKHTIGHQADLDDMTMAKTRPVTSHGISQSRAQFAATRSPISFRTSSLPDPRSWSSRSKYPSPGIDESEPEGRLAPAGFTRRNAAAAVAAMLAFGPAQVRAVRAGTEASSTLFEAGDTGKTVFGTVRLSGREQEDNRFGNFGTVKIDYDLKGLKPGKHGFHIHVASDFSDGCKSAGPHFNPDKDTYDPSRPVGDLASNGGDGSIVANEKGVAKGSIVEKRVKLVGDKSVIGRSFVVHADPDDGKGNAGARLACGEIKLSR